MQRSGSSGDLNINSSRLLLADIIGRGNNTKTKQAFQVNVTQILKAPRKNLLRIYDIYSPLRWEDCGYALRTTQQSQLLIAGYLRRGKLYFTRCHLVYFWHRLTREQRLGFEAAYRMGCKCQVQPCIRCWGPCPEPDFTECVWKQRGCNYSIWEGSRSLYYTCVPSTSGRCEWTRIQRNYQYQTPPPLTTITGPIKIF
ncbi:PREDICTED: metalloproteinase inhibitor 1-like [Ceratotherium simum simum]|uniref:Metalloproteinase inhibitor 1-like n=1 Tax=Ceratotherium simum simum TaxID=73337 RepID=A0ABM1D8F8_CERSS|nr:PREDICTED: metalloproteinase inhibitor 1-like [Ceratotherium simum simum]